MWAQDIDLLNLIYLKLCFEDDDPTIPKHLTGQGLYQWLHGAHFRHQQLNWYFTLSYKYSDKEKITRSAEDPDTIWETTKFAMESYLEVLWPTWPLGSSVCRRAGWGWWAGGRLCRAVCYHIQRTQLQALWAPGRYTRTVTETVLPWGRGGRERWTSSTLSQKSETEVHPLSSAGKNPR